MHGGDGVRDRAGEDIHQYRNQRHQQAGVPPGKAHGELRQDYRHDTGAAARGGDLYDGLLSGERSGQSAG